MSKDPAVLFYTSDFLSGTFTMTNEQVGMYIRLLCYQHQKGKLTEKDMLAICPNRDEDVWGKFDLEDGFYVNKRMYEEAEKRKNFTESRKKNLVSKKKSSHMESHMASHMEAHMENENVNVNNSLTKEGGMGGDFNWESVKGYFLNADQWMYHFCSSKSVSRDSLMVLMREFINDMELRNEYKPLKELQRHFTNWYNKSKTKKNVKPTRNTGAYELLDDLRSSFSPGGPSHDGSTTNL